MNFHEIENQIVNLIARVEDLDELSMLEQSINIAIEIRESELSGE